MPHRFYCPALVHSGGVTLADAEAHHLTNVLRHQPGDLVELFNGEGLVATSRVTLLRKRDVELEVVSVHQVPGPATFLTIATAVPKGDRFDWLVEKATELGVTRLIPLTTSRAVVDPRTTKLEKLRQAVIAACKQSGRSHLMQISPVTSWNEFLKQIEPDQVNLIAHPGGEQFDRLDRRVWEGKPQRFTVAIGPEGGFSDDEVVSAMALGVHVVQLGALILRIETAAIALAAKILV